MNRPGPICPDCDEQMTPLFTSAVCERCENPERFWGLMPKDNTAWTSFVYLTEAGVQRDYEPYYYTQIVEVILRPGTPRPAFDITGRSSRTYRYLVSSPGRT